MDTKYQAMTEKQKLEFLFAIAAARGIDIKPKSKGKLITKPKAKTSREIKGELIQRIKANGKTGGAFGSPVDIMIRDRVSKSWEEAKAFGGKRRKIKKRRVK